MTEAASMNWSREFDEPISLPDGGELRTFLDAGRYVDALPHSMHEREEWQAVMEVLLSAVEGREPVSLLRIALTLALQESAARREGHGADETNSALSGIRRLVELRLKARPKGADLVKKQIPRRGIMSSRTMIARFSQMPNTHVSQRLAGIHSQLMAAHQASIPMSNVTKGAERESFISQFLSKVLPPVYRFGTGDATDIDGNRSGQLDVVVEYPFGPTLPAVHGETRLYLAESIAAVIEVKSSLPAQCSGAKHNGRLHSCGR